MCKLNKWGKTRIDPCMRQVIQILRELNVKTLACCCGHGKYPMTIVINGVGDRYFDMVSGAEIPRKKKFYKKDKQGFYFIPEVLENRE